MVKIDDILKELGPNAAIVFASWIFMGFLQSRYDSSIMRYRETISEYRANEGEGNLRDQILIYRRRCKMMGWATLVGLVSAILLIASLLFACLDLLVPHTAIIPYAGIASALLGFLLLIISATLVVAEGGIVSRQLDNEMRNLPGIAES